MADYGVPVITEPSVMSSLIQIPSILNKVSNFVIKAAVWVECPQILHYIRGDCSVDTLNNKEADFIARVLNVRASPSNGIVA